MLLTTLSVFTMQQITRWEKIVIFRFAHLGKRPTWTLRSSLSVLTNLLELYGEASRIGSALKKYENS